jgi:hypothetical protein
MMPRLCAAVTGAVIVYGGLAPVGAGAQAGTLTAAVSGIVPIPVGSLVHNRGVGGGGALALRFGPATLPDVAVRLELSGLLPASTVNSPSDQSPVVANGSNAVIAMAGPEFDVPSWGGHFYTTGTAGAARIWSSSHAVAGATPGGGEPFSTMTTRVGTNFAWSGGGGYVTRRTRGGIAGDFGLRYSDLGDATYVTSYPGGTFGINSTVYPGASTVARHRVTFLAPSLGLSWRP